MADIKEVHERVHLRRTFTRTVTSIDANLLKGEISPAVVDMEFLKEKHARLQTLDKAIQNRMLENYNETEYSKEIDVAEEFSHTWHSVKNRLDSAVSAKLVMAPDEKPGTNQAPASTRNFRLPRIEFKQFDDDPKGWLSFWGQFRKVHEDPSIHAEDKFQYLLQALKEGSDAKALVERFPPSCENYSKAVEQLIERFAREDMLIQVYIREILQLVLSQSRNQLDIKTLYDKLSTYLLALESLGITKSKYETILYPLVESSIPENILIAWNRNRAQGNRQLAHLLDFLKDEVEAEERIRLARSDFTNASTHSDLAGAERVPTASCIVSNVRPDTKHGKDTCLLCKKSGHSVYECSKACKMSLEEKKEVIKKGGCCYICLRKGHMANKCKTFVKCLICSKKHSVLLCPTVHREENKSENILVCHKTNTTTLLQTLVVNITYNGQTKKVRALLDSGSQRSYVRSSIAEELKLQQVGTESIAHIVFGGDDRPAKVYKCFELQVSDLSNSFFLKINALEQPKLCGHLPKLNSKKLLYELDKRGIKISDIYFPDTEIDLLIGSDYLGSIITNNLVSVGDNVIAMETKLGWTVQGPTQVLSGYSSVANTITSVSCFSQMNIPDMWSVELLRIQDPYEKQCKQADNREILNNFYDNISVNGEGRYEVSLLWKEGCPKLNPNYEVAKKRLESTTKKLMSTGNLKDYDYVLNDWKEKNIIEEVINDDQNTGHYLPHHMVIKPSSTTTKVRPVFDASARDQYGQSLNSCVNKGINMIEMIPRLLLSFRKCAHGVIADVKQAFLQISVIEEDRNYLKFLWWDNPDTCDRIVTYRHNRVVFGISCSPFLLSATINYHLDNCSEDYKETAKKLKECLYSDNAVTSFDTTAELDAFILQATHLMSQGHFELRGWVTAPERRQETASETSVLGMMWNTQEDTLHCNVNIRETLHEKVTKRHLLSVTQHVFDPIGVSCVTTLIPKLIIQKVWESKIGWDQEIPVELKEQFIDWQKSAHLINKCNIPRRVSFTLISQSKTSLHIFCDASERAYAACAFLKTEDKAVSVRLLLAKNRVAPAHKKMSLPRLELMSAVIASRLYREIIDSRLLDDCQSYEKYFWTDSAVVLAWLQRKAEWKPFVSNRVKEILTVTKKSEWHHVPEAPLPIDRVENATAFQVSGVDLAGPLFLKNQQKCWIALFTCATYRAVHLELVESLSTSSFLMAFRRFVARRGRINMMYSDNGTNFQGTANLLKEVDWAEIEAATATNFPVIKWKFIPPKSPWWGGWWERLVKVMKEILRRMLGNAVVDFVELSTLLCDCEATINSRPLTYVATDDDSLRPLSPMLFLHGLSSSDLPDLDQIDSKNINIRLKFLQKLRSDFRQRFKNEYLALLISKNRCKPNLPKVGDIVLEGTEASRLYWPLGIIMELFTGADGQTRVAKVRTAAGVRVRTCQKLYPLELSALTEEWLRLPTDEGKKPDDKGMQSGPNCVLEQDASSKSEETPIHFRSSNVEPLSAMTRKGRVVKIPQRFLD